jgi:SNF family Na+-dependent transporter
VGLGNVWRFPVLVYKFGGGTFFIPYLMALFLIGIPLLILEFGLGAAYQSGDIIAFGSIHKRLRGVGFASVFEAFMVVIYYNAIIAWALRYVGYCSQYPLPWMPGPKPIEGGDNATLWTSTGKANDFFYTNVLEITDPSVGFTSFQAGTWLLMVFVWLCIFVSIHKGVAVTGKVVWVTCILPALMILILLITSMTLEGSGAGIYNYIGRWDFSKLASEPTMWSEAVTQIFFSLGITFGIMTAYSSYNDRNSRCVQDALIVGVANSIFSFIAGFAVYGILGYLAFASNVPVEDVAGSGGVSLAFIVYPVGLGLIGGDAYGSAVGGAMCAMFFLTLFFLGIDSAFSLVEASVTALADSRAFSHIKQMHVAAAACLLGAVLGAFYSTNLGLYLLDVVDYFINNVAMLLVGLMEAIAGGWVYGIAQQKEEVGNTAVYVFAATWLFGTILITVTAQVLSAGIGVLVGLLVYIIGSALAIKLAKVEAREAAKELFLGNVESLREDLNKVVTANGGWRIPFFWSVCIKFFIPIILIVMFSLTVTAQIKQRYGDYTWGYQLLGVTIAVLGISAMLLSFVAPDAFERWMPPMEKKRIALGREGKGVEMRTNPQDYRADPSEAVELIS